MVSLAGGKIPNTISCSMVRYEWAITITSGTSTGEMLSMTPSCSEEERTASEWSFSTDNVPVIWRAKKTIKLCNDNSALSEKINNSKFCYSKVEINYVMFSFRSASECELHILTYSSLSQHTNPLTLM